MISGMYIFVFVVGTAIGSFLNVLIMRMIKGENFVTGRSRCDHCKKTLSWYDMIPIVSYCWYKGYSRCCKVRLSLQYPIVESLVGILFVWWLLVGTLFFRLVASPLSTMQPLFWLVIAIILIGIFVTDLFYGLIPSPFVWGGVVLTIIYRVILMMAGVYQGLDLFLSIIVGIGASGFFWLLRYITKGKGMGEGDVILAVFVGILLGWPRVVVGVMSSFILGAVIALILMFFGKKKFGQTIPFGPFMIMGVVVGLLWGEQILTMLF